MSLVDCPECNASVSDKATACPRCGYPQPGAASSIDDANQEGRDTTVVDFREYADTIREFIAQGEAFTENDEIKQAVRSFGWAVDRGSLEAQFKLGELMFMEDISDLGDGSEAVQLISEAASRGSSKAMMFLAEWHLQMADCDLSDEHIEQSIHWLRKAVNGRARKDAATMLGNIFAVDRPGFSKDEVTALQYFKISAALGDPEAQFQIGVSYEFGWGTEAIYSRAEKWYRKACDSGHQEARKHLDSLVARKRLELIDDEVEHISN